MQTLARHRILNMAAALIAVAAASSAQQIIPAGIGNRESVTTEDLRLSNDSPFDAAMVSVRYEVEGHTPALPLPMRLEPGQTVTIGNLVETLFGLTTDTRGTVTVLGPESVVAEWRMMNDGVWPGPWLPSISASRIASTLESPGRGRRRAALPPYSPPPPPPPPQPPTPPPPPPPETATRVHVGDVTTFSGSYGVSGTATIMAKNMIRLTNLRHNGGAPGLDMRIGLTTTSRKSFTVLLSTGRQVFNNATVDLLIPDKLDLNSFDTFTVWCNEFSVLIAEGRFRAP